MKNHIKQFVDFGVFFVNFWPKVVGLIPKYPWLARDTIQVFIYLFFSIT